MRYKKIAPKNNNWTKTSQVLKELFETLHCSKCKNNLHDSQQFLKCGHFSCFSCTKNDNRCIECQCSVDDDILKDDTMRKILQACCTIAEQVGFKLLSNNGEATSKGNLSIDETNSHAELSNLSSLSNNANQDFNGPQDEPGKILTKRRGGKKLTEIVAKKAKIEKIIPTFRVPKNVDKKNHHGETKLQEECKKGHIDNVKALLDAGANPNTFCAAGWTPLQECADYGYIDIAKLLLDKGADVNKKGHLGRTPLHEATQADRLSMVKFLLEQNAQKDIADDAFKTPIAYYKSEEVKMLLDDVKIRSPRTNRRTRVNNPPPNKICNNSPGVSKNIPGESHHISVRMNNPPPNEKCNYSPGVSNNAPEKSHPVSVRMKNPPPNKICDNSPGVSNNAPKKSHHVSARNAVKVEKYYDSTSSESEDDAVPKDERCSQNVTICHQQYENDTFDTEEIDVLN